MGRHPFGTSIFITHFVTFRHFPHFQRLWAYYNEAATPKSTSQATNNANTNGNI
jgi:hypothetical protein